MIDHDRRRRPLRRGAAARRRGRVGPQPARRGAGDPRQGPGCHGADPRSGAVRPRAARGRKRGTVATPAQRVVINERVCEGCGDCGVKSNCLSVQPVDTPFGRKTRIDQTSLQSRLLAVSRATARRSQRWCPSAARRPQRRQPRARGRRMPEAVDPASLPQPELVVPADGAPSGCSGIGGTGVVTVSQVLGTAAMLDGLTVRGLDQTGLSQKAGPVVSDLRLTHGDPQPSNKATSGTVDLYLAFDLLVAASDAHLAGASEQCTVVVGSTTSVPTGSMVLHPDRGQPSLGILRDRLESCSRPDVNRYVDASAVNAGLFGDGATTNMFLVGVAFQAGTLPFSAESVERAIELNGVAVERNVSAFRWGRRWAIDAPLVEQTAGLSPVPGHQAEQGNQGKQGNRTDQETQVPLKLQPVVDEIERTTGRTELAVRVTRFAADLVDYQDVRYAAEYLRVVATVAGAEAGLVPGSAELTDAVARNLYKLMAYKDEYEVARSADDRRVARRAPGRGWAGREGAAALAPADAACARHEPQAAARPERRTAARHPAAGEGPARPLVRPVRAGRDAAAGAGDDSRVPRRRRPTHGRPHAGNPCRGGVHRIAPGSGARVRAPEAAARRRLSGRVDHPTRRLRQREVAAFGHDGGGHMPDRGGGWWTNPTSVPLTGTTTTTRRLDAFTRHLDPRLGPPVIQWAEIDGRSATSSAAGEPRRGQPDVQSDRQGRRDGGVLPRQSESGRSPLEFLTDREPIRPEYRDRETAAGDGRAGAREDLVVTRRSGMIYEQPLKHDPEGVGIMFSAFNRWLEDDWGYDYEGRIFASPYISLADLGGRDRRARTALIGLGARTICMRPAAPTTVSGSRTPGDPVLRPVLGPRQRGRDHRRRARRRQRLLHSTATPGRASPPISAGPAPERRHDALDGAGDLRLPRVTRLRPAVHPLPEPAGDLRRERRRVPPRLFQQVPLRPPADPRALHRRPRRDVQTPCLDQPVLGGRRQRDRRADGRRSGGVRLRLAAHRGVAGATRLPRGDQGVRRRPAG